MCINRWTTIADDIPPLVDGDRLTRAEFDARYENMPHLKRAELIGGRVYLSSLTTLGMCGSQRADLIGWLAIYAAPTPAVSGGAHSTIYLDWDNEPQPDALLRIDSRMGGSSATDERGFLHGPPELIAEVTRNAASYDLHDKLNAYRRNGVREYVVWRVLDEEVDWFVLRRGQYERLAPDEAGVVHSEVFPGLWLDVDALLAGNMAAVLDCVREGTQSEEHAAFVARLSEGAFGRGVRDPAGA